MLLFAKKALISGEEEEFKRIALLVQLAHTKKERV
jgi:hypothetical protein